MYIYAQLNDNVVMGITEVSRKMEGENLVEITEFADEVELGSIYNEKTGLFTLPEPVELPTPPQSETLEQKIARLEETIEQNNLMHVDITLGLYEEILLLRDEIAQLAGSTND